MSHLYSRLEASKLDTFRTDILRLFIVRGPEDTCDGKQIHHRGLLCFPVYMVMYRNLQISLNINRKEQAVLFSRNIRPLCIRDIIYDLV